jgi:hypothetical protein
MPVPVPVTPAALPNATATTTMKLEAEGRRGVPFPSVAEADLAIYKQYAGVFP